MTETQRFKNNHRLAGYQVSRRAVNQGIRRTEYQEEKIDPPSGAGG
jgi:hypothetical protein